MLKIWESQSAPLVELSTVNCHVLLISPSSLFWFFLFEKCQECLFSPSQVCLAKFQKSGSFLVRNLECRKNECTPTWTIPPQFGCIFKLYFNQGLSACFANVNYLLCEAHTHYGINYIAEETEVHQISRPGICRGWLPVGPNKSELKELSTCKHLPARLPIKSTTDLGINQESYFPALHSLFFS